ncbi:hypothetical protein FAGAP_3016 [Fusarium agapanthi]|uniref:Uncharacterized protein n=1 Tax=Fusarium agapanthi TaxID=1803897 RepID=A0A9P5EFC5_9HYPO|nr:hypothetical protein FAGAP_3016 [Fusarium agapanthi]
MISKRPGLVQISVSRSAEEQRLIPAFCSNLARCAKELETFRKHLYADAKGGELSFGIMERVSPHAVAVSNPLFSRLEQFHVLLGRVFIDIVDRWFTDEKARFPERMLLEPSEEELLRWVASSGCVPDYAEHAGCWRSDLLFGRSPDGLRDESPYVCEINGRLPLNAVMGISLGDNDLRELGASKGGLEPVNSMNASYDNLMALFKPDKPLYSIRDKWPGADSKILSAIDVARGRPPVEAFRPQDLEMVSRGVLTAEEAEFVADGIIQTINPWSEGLQNLLRNSKSDPNLKNKYIYKLCRDGMGHGIELGKNLTQKAWLEHLEKLANPDVLRPHDDAAVIQRLVDHDWYDVVRHEVSTDDGPHPNKFHLIGSMFMFQIASSIPLLGVWALRPISASLPISLD